jgi:hypothetical protein
MAYKLKSVERIVKVMDAIRLARIFGVPRSKWSSSSIE